VFLKHILGDRDLATVRDIGEAVSADREGQKQVVTKRAIIAGLLLIPANCYWMAVMEIQWNSLDSTCVSLFFHVVFLLLVLTLINALISRKFPKIAFTQAELMVVYVMLSIASAVMGRDSFENLLPVLGHLFWFANPTNKWTRFWPYVPEWLAPQDKDVLKGYYLGNSSLYQSEHIRAWFLPVLFWVSFVVVLTFIMLCINVLVRRQWADRERLTFPIVQIPLAVTSGKSFFNNRIMWLGFILPVFIQTLNNLNYFYPSVPTLHLKLQNWGVYFTTKPWNGIGWLPVGFFPFAIGISFFLPLDLSFSCWFFYVLRKLVDVGCVALGLRDVGVPPSLAKIPYVAEQGTGAWVGLSIALVWVSRKQIGEIFRTAFTRGVRADDPQAGMSYRTAIVGIGIGFLILLWMCRAMGMSLWLPVIYFAFYFILSVGITRVRAELGPPAHELNWVNPEKLMVTIFGTQALGTQNLTLLSYMFWFNRGYRSHPMPHQLEGFKIGQEMRMESRRLVVAMMLAAAVGAVASLWALLDIFYRNGEATARIMSYSTGIGYEAFTRLQDWTDNPRPTDWIALVFTGLGSVIALILAMAKGRLLWWPFHPIGYALANSYALEYFWSTMFIGWFIKFWIVRYGGAKFYRQALPFFLGLVLGDYVVASLWSLIGSILGVSTYRTFIF
jgi:hypothetical protein